MLKRGDRVLESSYCDSAHERKRGSLGSRWAPVDSVTRSDGVVAASGGREGRR